MASSISPVDGPLNAIDLKTLPRCHDYLKRQYQPKQAAEVEADIARLGWDKVAVAIAWACQDLSMKLRPFDCPPCKTRLVDDPSDDWGYREGEVAVLRRLEACDLSRYEPDPKRACAAVEKARQRVA